MTSVPKPGSDLQVEALSSLGGRFRADRLLKRGGGLATFLGTDTERGRKVVIKAALASRIPAAARMLFEHEARVLREVESPSLAPLLDFGCQPRPGETADDLLYLVMPYVEGTTLEDRLAGGGPLRARDAIAVARGILAALDEAHRRGVLHRDVKPANVIVSPGGLPGQGDEPGAPPRATLIDFGLARSLWLDPALSAAPAGTARYMSPEQAGLIERGVDARSDLYSLGVVLFEALAGRPPFLGTALGEVLRQHLTAPPPDLRAIGVRVPRALEEVVERLLRKDPRDRYQSAEAAIADLDDIAAALDRGELEPAVTIGLHDRRATLTEPAFVGRSAELAALAAALERARGGDGGLVRLEAESGGGKTRLLDELAGRAPQAGGWVVRGQGVDRAAQRPFQVLDGLQRALGAAAHEEPHRLRAIRERLGDRAAAVAAVLPRLARVLGAAGGAPSERALGPEAWGEQRTLGALVALLDSLGSPGEPALLLLDDCQWADDLSVKLLGAWRGARGPAGAARPRRHALLVAAFRSEEAPPGHALRSIGADLDLALEPLGPEDVRRLAESMAGGLPEEAALLVARLSEGSPFMAGAVLQGLVETGALVPERAAGWRLEPGAVEEIRSSRQAAAFLARRVERLDRATLRLLEVGAVLGRDFDVELAAALFSGSRLQAPGYGSPPEARSPEPEAPEAALAALEEARRRHFVWMDAQAARARFVHDKLREALLARIPDGERRGLHGAAAARIERDGPSRHFELAYHFDEAGEVARALPHALEAARRARARFSLEIAERQYRIAARGARDAGAATRCSVAEGLGDVLMLRGRYEEAQKELLAARALAAERVDQARMDGKLGELAFKRGDIRTASESIERALRILGRFIPRSAAGFALALAWELGVQAAHTLGLGRALGRGRAGGGEAAADRLAMRLLSRLAYAYWFQGGPVPTLWAHLREMNLAERYPPSAELAQAYSEHAPAMTMVPWFSRAVEYAERSLAIRRDLGDIWGQGQSLHFYSVALYSGSRFVEAAERAREAMRLLERTGDRWEANDAAANLALALLRAGELREAADLARRIHRSAAEIGDAHSAGVALDVWARATGGKVPAALIDAELARPSEDVQTYAEVLLASAVNAIGDGRPLDAVEALRRAIRLVERARLRQEYVAPAYPWLATALRLAAEAAPPAAGRRRAALLARARRAARRAIRVARRYRNNLPHLLREAALIEAGEGRPERAERRVEESIAVAESQGARYERALSLLARGRIGAELGRAGAPDDAARAAEELRAIGAPEPEGRAAEPATPALADRFATVLASGRRIASALTREEVFRAASEAALALLRGERCLVLEPAGAAERASFDVVWGGGRAGAEAGAGAGAEPDGPPPPFSRAVAERALLSGRPVAFVEGPEEPDLPAAGGGGGRGAAAARGPTDSLLLEGVRSALCAPISVRGRPAALLYISHRGVGGLFGEAEERLAEFIATLAGAALENAEGFRQAREAVRARDDFLSVASHELKTPLTALLLNVQAIVRDAARQGDGGDAAAARDRAAKAEAIERTARRVGRLVDDLLDITRITAGRLELSLEIGVDLREIAREAAAEAREEAQRAGCEVRLDAPAPVAGRWDRPRLEQVVRNLVSNALKYGRGKPVDISVAGAGRLARVSVRDRGIGISPEDQRRIFERFERAAPPRQYGGFGLGLWIARHLVEAHGGRISVESRSGEGATFTVEMPKGGPATIAMSP